MENRYYKILGSSIKISSNIERDIVILDKAFCNFIEKKITKNPSLEIIITANNSNKTAINNAKIFAITPVSFDGWERSSKFWSGKKSNVGRFVSKTDKIPDYINPSTDNKVFEINMNIDLPGVRGKYLVWLHYFINLFALDFFKKTSYIIHGGALEYKNNGLILAGRSGSGKSTLTYALAKSGLTYLTDECIFLDQDSDQMYPYPISPSFDKDNRSLFKEVNESFEEDEKLRTNRDKSFVDTKKIGLNVKKTPVIPKFVIFPKYKPGKKPEIKQLADNDAVKRLEDNIQNFNKEDELKYSNQETAQLLVSRCRCYELISNELEETVKLVKKAMSE